MNPTPTRAPLSSLCRPLTLVSLALGSLAPVSLALVSLTLVSLTLVSLTLVACGGSTEQAMRADLVEVVRGPLTISVTESGEIKAAKSTRVQNQMEGNSTVIFLIPEGTIVDKGDKLVELDSSQQVERKATQEIAVERAKAAVISGRQNLEILEKQVAAQNKAAKNTWDFAVMDKEKFYGAVLPDGGREMGEQEQSIKAEEAEIALADSALKLAKDRYNWSKILREKDFITKEELDRDRLDFESKETRLTLARNKLEILKKYTHVKTKAELDQNEADAELEFERTKAKGEAELTQTRADLKSKEAEDKLASERLENLINQIDSAIVRAPTPGIVVYATEGDRWRRRTIELGAQVRERQILIILPDTSRMLAELKVQEVMIDKIRPGLPARIKIDTTPRPLLGSVLKRAPLPDSGGRMGNPDLKEYKTTIQIEGNNEDNLLRPNMSATVEIIIAQLENVIYVPQAAVFSQGAVRYAWVDSPPGPVATPIETGEHNESYVVITKGLEAGQRVYLVEPRTENTPEFKQPERRRVRVPAAPEDEPDDPEGNAPNGPARVTKTARRRGREPGGRDEDPGPGPDTGNGGTGDGGTSDGGTRNASARRGPNMNSPAMAAFTQAQNQFKQVVKEHNPDLHQKIEAAGRGWSRDASIKAAIAADAGLTGPYASFEAARKTLMSSFGGRGRGKAADGQPGGGQGGGGQGGRRRRGGAERQADDAGDPEQPRREGDGN